MRLILNDCQINQVDKQFLFKGSARIKETRCPAITEIIAETITTIETQEDVLINIRKTGGIKTRYPSSIIPPSTATPKRRWLLTK